MDNQPLDNNEMLESSDSFEAVYETYAKSIYRFLYWRTKDVNLSEDLTSSVFEKAWRSRSSFRRGSVQAWLYRIARNVLTDHWRKRKELFVEDSDSLQETSAEPSFAEIMDKAAMVRRLQKAVNKLPRDMRLVVSLRFIEGLSCREVSKALGLSESNVRVIQYRALKKLRGHLQ